VTAELAVWAPEATAVQVILGGATPTDMTPDPQRPGWWRWPEPHHGRYAFVIDGERHPDPRSPWQPDGVDGPSHTVDHQAYRWTDGGWHGRPLASAVIYELHVGTFSDAGTYGGVEEHLDELVDLGVTAIELLPVNSFGGRWGWGYDGVAWFAPHPAYGTPDDLRHLVDACHQRGLAVLLDVVYNHVGPSGNHLWAFGPYFTDRHHTPWGQALNVDGPDSDEVRRYVIDNACMWLRDYHVDGLRLDAVHAIVDHSARHLLEELGEAVERLSMELGRTLWLIAESESNDPRLVRSREAHGYGLDGQWSDDLHHAVHVALTGEHDGYYADFDGLADVAKAWTDVFTRDGTYAPSLRRRHGRPVGSLPSRRFVTALQNHDQIGNRAVGDRIGALAGIDRQCIGAALTLLAPTVPLLFQGEEWAASTPFQFFTDHTDPELAEAVRTGRRREFAAFGWQPDDVPDPQDPETFRRCRLRWAERPGAGHAEMLEWYRALLRLRRSEPVLAGDVSVEALGADHLHLRFRGRQLAVHLGAGRVELRCGAHARPLLQRGDVTLDGDRLVLGGDAVVVLGPG
jgi:maltooligosyltrehalose trehalohydrolase